jgi:hypothetical protein
MTTHSFAPNPKSIGGMICAVCGKTRTHIMHAGQGVAEPREIEWQESPGMHEKETYTEEAAGPSEQFRHVETTAPSDYFMLESMPGFTEIRFHIPEPADRCEILLAAVEFLKRVAPQLEAK